VCNFLHGTISKSGGAATLMLMEFPRGIELDDAIGLRDGDSVTAAVRPEDLALTDDPHDGPLVTVLDSSYLGDHYQTRVTVGGLELIVHTDRRPATDTAHLRLRQSAITLVT
jgi:ABC-type Fe3+/spermidine/putrescine transport system ATPase subunit